MIFFRWWVDSAGWPWRSWWLVEGQSNKPVLHGSNTVFKLLLFAVTVIVQAPVKHFERHQCRNKLLVRVDQAAQEISALNMLDIPEDLPSEGLAFFKFGHDLLVFAYALNLTVDELQIIF